MRQFKYEASFTITRQDNDMELKCVCNSNNNLVHHYLKETLKAPSQPPLLDIHTIRGHEL